MTAPIAEADRIVAFSWIISRSRCPDSADYLMCTGRAAAGCRGAGACNLRPTAADRKAAALIVAEIERFDRAANGGEASGG